MTEFFRFKMGAVGTVTPAQPLEQQTADTDTSPPPQLQADVTSLDPADDETS